MEETWLFIKLDDVSSEKFDETAQMLTQRYNQDSYVIRLNGVLEVRGKDGRPWHDLGKQIKNLLV